MDNKKNTLSVKIGQFLVKHGIGIRAKLIAIFIVVQVIPLILLTILAWDQVNHLGDTLRDIAVEDSAKALNDSAVENIERMSTGTAKEVARFLYDRDDDLLYLSSLEPDFDTYKHFGENQTGRLIDKGEWALAEDGQSWVQVGVTEKEIVGGVSTNSENDDMDGFHYRPPEDYQYNEVPLYDEIVFIGLDGMEQIKYVSPDSTKVNYPMSTEKRDVSKRENTYVKAETYFEKLQELKPGEIYVSDVTGAYVGSNYIGMYAPDIVQAAADDRGYDIEFDPLKQAYAGEENPNGQRFEGIVRYATPVADSNGEVIGYVSLALNHDHIMEFVDHLTPMSERYTQLPSAFEGNYAFIWDYNCRSICHPRHHSIVGFDPETGEPEVPWLETSIYEGWQESGVEKWTDYVEDIPEFFEQSRDKKPHPELTKNSIVGLDGRYLNNAPQCTGWMDLTGEGGSGSFYILWSGIYKLNTAAAIPYYTGQYAPSEENGFSKRGFGFVAIGAGLEDFTRPAEETRERLDTAILATRSETSRKLAASSGTLIILMVAIAIWVSFSITGNITNLIKGVSRFRRGERHFRFDALVKDEFGTLADSFDDMADNIVNTVNNPLSITSLDHKVIYMNEQGLTICEKTFDEVIGSYYGDNSIYPAGSEYDPIMALERNTESEIYYSKSSDRYLKGNANYLYDTEGEKTGYIIETADVTDVIKEQKKIEEQKTLLDMIFASSPDLIWYIDADRKYVTVNPRFASISGKATEEFVGKTVDEMFPQNVAAVFGENDRKAIALDVPMYSEERLEFADGHVETLDSVRTPIFDTSGGVVGLLGFARNMSARVEMEIQLRKTQLDLEAAVKEANRANEHKGEFLARMSHEIRTPMNAIIGLTSIVQKKLDVDSEIDIDEVASHLEMIENSSQHLLGLLNDILDISKIEAGKIELTRETADLTRLVDTVINIIQPRCDDKNITFTTIVDDFDPSSFMTDALRLRQVLINLLGNAVKFTPECGNIWLEVKQVGKEDGRTRIRFSVRDNGIGISDDFKPRIFESFEQVSGAGQKGGTGLGLAISKNIVHMFGGDIGLESEVGKGSCFEFEIWLEETEAAWAEVIDDEDISGRFAGRHMLLVDDVEINRMIVASLLEDTGFIIDEADDGAVALEMFKRSPAGYYDMILMDVQMPVMDGYESSDAIRALDRSDAKTVPIVALTANAFKEDIDHAIAHGMNEHIAKPVEFDILLQILFKYIGD